MNTLRGVEIGALLTLDALYLISNHRNPWFVAIAVVFALLLLVMLAYYLDREARET